MQMVNLVEGGERARMSKRRGDFARLDDLLDDIGVDAPRFFMLMRSHETRSTSISSSPRTQLPDNPVYYAQYAHARICSLFRMAAERGAETRRRSGSGGQPRAGRAGADRDGCSRCPSRSPGRDEARAARHLDLRAGGRPPTSTPSTADCRVVGAGPVWSRRG
jgi:hypothetical protein